MQQYILKRLLLTIPTLFGAAVLVFVLLRMIPGMFVSVSDMMAALPCG